LPSLTEEHSIPAPQFELFTICRILRASWQFPHRDLRALRTTRSASFIKMLIKSSQTVFFWKMCYYQLTLHGYNQKNFSHNSTRNLTYVFTLVSL
jgi:hypothetical protein